MKPRQISPGFIEDSLACLAAHGLSAQELRAKTGLPQDPQEPVTAEAFGRLWREISQLTGDEFFGLAARPMRPGSFALMCHATMGSRNLAEALRRALSFLTVVLDDPRGTLSTGSGLAVITLDHEQVRPDAFAGRSYWLILMGLICWLAGRRIPLIEVSFACAAPPDRPEYLSFFGSAVRFDQPQTRLSFASEWLRRPVTRDAAALRRFLRAAPGNILTRYREEGSTAALVRRYLAARAPADWPDLPELAQILHMSPATLRRRLRAEGLSFAQLRDSRRESLACQLLKEGRLTIAGVAAELGYSEPGAFYRAFQKWQGISPAAWRERAKALPG